MIKDRYLTSTTGSVISTEGINTITITVGEE